jgi:hypothetical protein
MKKGFVFIFVFVSALHLQAQTITTGSLLEELTDREAIIRYPVPEYTLRQRSSMDVLHIDGLSAPSSDEIKTGAHLVWDSDMGQFVNSGVYARIKKLSNHNLALVYSAGPNVYLRIKKEGYSAWGSAIEVARDVNNQYNYTNSELIELANGSLIYTWNARPKEENVNPYKIMLKTSDINGLIWRNEQTVYTAGTNSGTGCWEPALLQLPHGEIQLFFANEAPYTQSNYQNISLLRSFDNGATWSGNPVIVSYRAGKRDGMPVPVYLQDEKGIVLAIEDNGINGTFKPVIVHSGVSDNWTNPVPANSPHRWHALHPDYQLASNIYAGAPYLIQLHNKETVLSVQSGEGRQTPNTLDHANMQVYIGDAEAKNFARKSTPFAALPERARALWSSVCQINDSTVVAVASIEGLAQNNGIWISTGRITYPQSNAIEAIKQEKEQLLLLPSVLRSGETFTLRLTSDMDAISEIRIYESATGRQLYRKTVSARQMPVVDDFTCPGAFLVGVQTKRNRMLYGKLIVY